MSEGQTSGRYSIIQACACDDRAMTPGLLMVLTILGTYSDAQGWCYPKQESMARRLGIHRQNLNPQLQRLAELGYIQIVHQFRTDGGQRANAYRLMMDFQLPLDRYRVPPPVASSATPPPVCADQTPPVCADQTPPVCADQTPRTSHVERPMQNEIHPSAAARAPSATAATPRECGFAFLETEPLYAAACLFLRKPSTRTEIGRWARAIAELREVGATAAQLRTAARRFRDMFPRARLTITALSSNWTLLLQGDQPYGTAGQDTEDSRAARRAAEEQRQREWSQLVEGAIAELTRDLGEIPAQDARAVPRPM